MAGEISRAGGLRVDPGRPGDRPAGRDRSALSGPDRMARRRAPDPRHAGDGDQLELTRCGRDAATSRRAGPIRRPGSGSPGNGPRRAGRHLERPGRPGRILVQGQPVRKRRSPSAPQDFTSETQEGSAPHKPVWIGAHVAPYMARLRSSTGAVAGRHAPALAQRMRPS